MIWKQHPLIQTHEVSDEGWVRQFLTGRVLKGNVNVKGYHYVRLNGVMYRTNRLVLETFIGFAPSKRHEGAHDDGVKLNNRLDNLAWKTPKQNQADRVLHGTSNRGKRNPMYKHGKYSLQPEDNDSR